MNFGNLVEQDSYGSFYISYHLTIINILARYQPIAKDRDGKRVRILDAHWLNFGWGEEKDPITGQTQMVHHPDEVWVRYGFSRDESWKKVIIWRRRHQPDATIVCPTRAICLCGTRRQPSVGQWRWQTACIISSLSLALERGKFQFFVFRNNSWLHLSVNLEPCMFDFQIQFGEQIHLVPSRRTSFKVLGNKK